MPAGHRLPVAGVALLFIVASGIVGGPAVATDAAMGRRMANMEEHCRQEILDLHRFFAAWFNGEIENTDKHFERVAGVLDAAFEIVAPDGRLIGRDALLEGLRQAHDGRAGSGFRIWIENQNIRILADGLGLVTYEEWQESGDEIRGRVSTALLAADEEAPNGVRWLYLHETWLPAPSTD